MKRFDKRERRTVKCRGIQFLLWQQAEAKPVHSLIRVLLDIMRGELDVPVVSVKA